MVSGRITYADIARLAHVGHATVERVLNNRGNVRPEKVERVIAATKALGYPRQLQATHPGVIRIEVILVQPETTFYSRLSRQFERIASSVDKSVMIHRTFVDGDDPAGIAKHIRHSPFRRSGLIIAAPDDGEITKALQEFQASGAPVIQVVSRSAGGMSEFVGIDNYAAGRTAAMFAHRMTQPPGSVIALTHSQAYEAHRDRIRGFSDYLGGLSHCDLDFVFVPFCYDDFNRTSRLLQEAFRRWPEIVAIYNSGGHNSAVLSVLSKHPRRGEIFFVGHELTDNTRAALRNGVMAVVLDQSPEAQARRSIDLMLARLGLLALDVENSPVPFITFTAQSV